MFFGIFMFLCDFSWLSCLLLPAERKYSFFRKLSSRLVNDISKSIKTDFYTFLRCLKSSLLLWNTKVVKKQYFYVFYLNRSAYWFFDTKNLENMYFLCFFLTTYIYSLWSYFSKSSNTPNLPQQKHPEMYFSCKGCHGPLCLLSFLSGALCLLCFWDKISKICGFCVYSHNNNVTFTHCILRVLVWINLELVAFVNHPRWPRSSWVCSAIAGLLKSRCKSR